MVGLVLFKSSALQPQAAYMVVLDFKKHFRAASSRAELPVERVREYPSDAACFQKLHPEAYQRAYPDEGPVPCRVCEVELGQLVRMVPMRKSRSELAAAGGSTFPSSIQEPMKIGGGGSLGDFAHLAFRMMQQMHDTQLQTLALMRGLTSGDGSSSEPATPDARPRRALSAAALVTPAAEPMERRLALPAPPPTAKGDEELPPPEPEVAEDMPERGVQPRTAAEAASILEAALKRKAAKEQGPADCSKEAAGGKSGPKRARTQGRPAMDADGRPVHWHSGVIYTDAAGRRFRVKVQKTDRKDTA
jgi:hypothetical protein